MRDLLDLCQEPGDLKTKKHICKYLQYTIESAVVQS